MNPRYRLTGQLEAGELAELYAGTRDDGLPVDIKLFHPQTSDVRYAQELADTARLLSDVPAEGIAQFVEIGLVKNRLAVVRERAEGLTLGAALQRLATKEVVLPSQVALALMIELLETVQQAHGAGVVHGAITPGNVTLTPDGHAVITDFGALRALQAVPALKKNFAARGRGTYRAPELGGGEPPSDLSDIYSLGAITYELLTLREPVPPGGGGNVSTRREALAPPSRVDRRLNGRIDPIVMRAMDPLSTRRFRSCAEFSAALRNFLANNGGMPLREDIQRVIRDLSPRQPALGPVPFSEPFMLREVDGAELPELNERSRVIEVRPAFIPSKPGPPLPDDAAETQEAQPAFEEYKPDPRHDGPLSGTPPAEEPVFDHDTNPSQAGPLEQGWEAPPGMAPPKPRRAMSLAGQPAVSSRPLARNPRLKVIEDYSTVGPAPENPFEEEDVTDRVQKKPARVEVFSRGSGARPVPEPAPAAPPAAASAPEPVPAAEEPARPDPAALQAQAREDEELAHKLRRRRRISQISLVLAFVAAFCFALAVLRLVGGQHPESSSKPVDPAARAVDDALKHFDEPHRAPGPAAGSAAAPPAPPAVASRPARSDADDYTLDEPPSKREAAFLTVLSDAPASVTIDGMKVRKRTPLFRYPVQPGERLIVLESLTTHERHQFKLGFEKGKLRRVEDHFKRPGR